MTQKQTILQLLNQEDWVCGTIFQGKYIPEYRTRINELRKDGFTINARRCTQHKHNGMMQEWRLEVNKLRQIQEQPPKTDINPVPTKNSHQKPNFNDSAIPPIYCCEINDYSPGNHSRGCKGGV